MPRGKKTKAVTSTTTEPHVILQNSVKSINQKVIELKDLHRRLTGQVEDKKTNTTMIEFKDNSFIGTIQTAPGYLQKMSIDLEKVVQDLNQALLNPVSQV